MKKKSTIFRIAILSAFASIITSCGSDNLENLQKIKLTEDPGIEKAENIVLTYSDSATVRVKISAPTLLNDKNHLNPKRIFPDGVIVDIYDERQIQNSKLTAEYAEHHPKTQQVILENNVNVWNTKNERLQSDEIIWDETTEEIYSTKKVKITTPTQIINGHGLRSSLDFNNWTMDSVTGIIQSDNLINTPF